MWVSLQDRRGATDRLLLRNHLPKQSRGLRCYRGSQSHRLKSERSGDTTTTQQPRDYLLRSPCGSHKSECLRTWTADHLDGWPTGSLLNQAGLWRNGWWWSWVRRDRWRGLCVHQSVGRSLDYFRLATGRLHLHKCPSIYQHMLRGVLLLLVHIGRAQSRRLILLLDEIRLRDGWPVSGV